MENREKQLQELKIIFSGTRAEIQPSEEKLEIFFEAFNKAFIPELHKILNLVKSKGNESPRFYTWTTELESNLFISFRKAKNPNEGDMIEISDRRFTNILFKLKDNTVTVEDPMIEKSITLNGPSTLVLPIPCSKNNPVGNALGWIEKIAGKTSEIIEKIT